MTVSYRSDLEYESNLSEFRVQAGLTIKELCSQADVKPPTYSGLNSGTIAPIYLARGRAGEAKQAAVNLANFFGVDLFDLFPRYFCSISEHKEVSEDEIVDNWHRGLVANDPLDNVLLKEREDVANEVCRKIRPIHREVLMARIVRGMTLEETGKILGGSRQRIMQLERKAKASIKWHAARSERFKELAIEGGV